MLRKEKTFVFIFNLITEDKCNVLEVKGADYANCNGRYEYDANLKGKLEKFPVFQKGHGNPHARYIFWGGDRWYIGNKDNLETQTGFIFESSKFDFEPHNNIIVVNANARLIILPI